MNRTQIVVELFYSLIELVLASIHTLCLHLILTFEHLILAQVVLPIILIQSAFHSTFTRTSRLARTNSHWRTLSLSLRCLFLTLSITAASILIIELDLWKWQNDDIRTFHKFVATWVNQSGLLTCFTFLDTASIRRCILVRCWILHLYARIRQRPMRNTIKITTHSQN